MNTINTTPKEQDEEKSKELAAQSESATAVQAAAPPAAPTTLPEQDEANYQERLVQVQQVMAHAGNPFLEAARWLLRTLAELPPSMEPEGVPVLNRLLSTELRTFTRLCDQLNLRREHMLAVRFILCTALDEAIGLRSYGGVKKDETGEWSTNALLLHFHGENRGGQTVFLLIGRLASAPAEHIHVLEIAHHVLSLGYKGDYGQQTDGPRKLEMIRHRLYSLVSASRDPVPRELSPRWQGVGKGKFALLRAIPVWVSASVLGLALFAQYGWSKYQLIQKTNQVERQIEALQKLQPPKVQPRAPLRLAEILSAEIAQGRVQVTDTPEHSLVVFKGDGMFTALTQLTPAARQTVEKVAEAINDVTGQVRVVGHTDNQPMLNTTVFANNQVLSEKRAENVAAVLQSKGVDSKRIQTQGMGESQPAAPNDSPQDRAKNRRVEIEVLNSNKS
jgi:type VI secretion system protein ImpK